MKTDFAKRVLPNFLKDKKGNVAMTFAIALLPVIGAGGAALDYSRLYSWQTSLQNANDAAAIAAAASGKKKIQELEKVAIDYLKGNGADNYLKPGNDSIVASLDGTTDLEIKAFGQMPTTFMGIFGYTNLPFEVRSSVQLGFSTPRDIALVLDVTGSMRNDMVALREAASDFVETVKPASGTTGDEIKIAVVPYVGAVNIGNSSTKKSYTDVTGDARYHATYLENRWYGYTNPCSYVPSGGGGGGSTPSGPGDPGDGGGDRSSLFDSLTNFASAAIGWFAPSKAHAATVLPSGFRSQTNCTIYGPSKINNYDLFAATNTTWKGCVEARPYPYDTTDAQPTTGNPDSYWVPYFWPDETDNFNGITMDAPNSYMSDLPMFDAWDNREYNRKIEDSTWVRAYNVLKYTNTNSPSIDDVGPITKGPNASCPDPILPLTKDRNTILNKINSLVHYEGSGTNSAQGMVWGWRAISPGAPFTEGSSYNASEKVVVIMTDGKNAATPSPVPTMYTDYTAYGSLRNNKRVGDDASEQTYANFTKLINDRFAETCANAKAAGVSIYTITFGTLDFATEDLYRNCASDPKNYVSVSDKSKLATAFTELANQINTVRLTK